MTNAAGQPDTSTTTPGGPSAVLYGQAHLIMHGNAAFKAAYGASCVGQPAREAMLDLPAVGFALMDRVLREGRALATRVSLPEGERRLVVAPRKDPETGDTYGIIVHLRPTAG